MSKNQLRIIVKTLLLFTVFFVVQCKKSEATVIQSESLLTDSISITTLLHKNQTLKNNLTEVLQFYKNRNYKMAWFTPNGLSLNAVTFYNQLQNYKYDFADNSLENEQLNQFFSNPNQSKLNHNTTLQLDVLLTATYFKYAHKAYSGIKTSPKNLDWYIPRSKKKLEQTLTHLLASESADEPLSVFYTQLKKKLRIYRIIQQKGGFPIIKTPNKTLNINDVSSSIAQVKQHLFLTSDLAVNDTTSVFTVALQKAIKNYQKRMGIEPNGQLNQATITELNRTIEYRIKQIIINMERLRWMPVTMETNYLWVNIPEFKLQIIENQKSVWSTNVVVGKSVNQTIIFKGKVSQIVLNPYWNIPTSIIEKEILPKIKENISYLDNHQMEIYDGKHILNAKDINWDNYEKGVPFTIRQKPGAHNALGKMKFLFPNNYDIYLHDTPTKYLFEESNRAFSHGCIRVENPKKLAIYILKNNPLWNVSKIDSVLQTNHNKSISIQPKIPVYIVYFTTWVDANNQLNFRNDVYNLDQKLSAEIFED